MRCPFCGGDSEAETRGRWAITLPLEPPSQNELAANKGNYAARRRYRKYRDDYILLLTPFARTLPLPAGKRRVLITRLYSARGQRYDKGNLVGGCKPLLDAMVRCHLLLDDNEQSIEDYYYQTRAGESGVRILVEELA